MLEAAVRGLRIYLLVFVLAGITAGTGFAQKFGKISDEEWNATPPDRFPDEAAVILFNNGDMDVSVDEIVLKRHVRIKVFRKDGVEDATSIDIPFRDGDKISNFKAHTILPHGKKHKVKDKYEKSSGYYKHLTFAFPNVEDGAILEYKYDQVHRRYSFMDPWFFQSEVYTMKSRFSVVLHPGFNYRVSRSNMPARTKRPIEEEYPLLGEQCTKYTWNVSDLPPAKDEPMMAAATNYVVSLRFQLLNYTRGPVNISFVKSWEDLGSLFAHELEKFGSDKDRIFEVASAACAGAASVNDTIWLIYNFVRDEIETRDEDASGYFEDIDAGTLLDQGYGSSRIKNVLLAEMLRSHGIEAYPMLIGTRGYTVWNPQLKQLSQFNHAVCFVDVGVRKVALDTGNRAVPYPFLPTYDLVGGGLVLDGDKSRPESFEHMDRGSGIETHAKLECHEDGSATYTTHICMRGYELDRYDEYLGDSLSHQEIAEELCESVEAENEVVSSEATLDVEGDSLVLDIVVTVPEYLRDLSGNKLMTPCLTPMAGNPFESDWRYFPIDFKYPRARTRTTVISLPEGMIANELPTDVNMSLDGWRYLRMSMTSGLEIVMMESLTIEKAIFAPGEYTDLKKASDFMTEAALDELLLTSSDM